MPSRCTYYMEFRMKDVFGILIDNGYEVILRGVRTTNKMCSALSQIPLMYGERTE